MANRNVGYQYETSPRKLEPEYKEIPKKKKPAPQKRKVKAKTKQKKKFKMSFEVKFFVNSMLVFAVVFAIIACQALVEQRYKEKENLKQEYSELMSKKNMNADAADDIRIRAADYGMQTKSATLIDLETSDYIESSENEVHVQKAGIFSRVANWIKNLF